MQTDRPGMKSYLSLGRIAAIRDGAKPTASEVRWMADELASLHESRHRAIMDARLHSVTVRENLGGVADDHERVARLILAPLQHLATSEELFGAEYPPEPDFTLRGDPEE